MADESCVLQLMLIHEPRNIVGHDSIVMTLMVRRIPMISHVLQPN